MIGILNHTWEWAIIWPTVIIISMVKLHDTITPIKDEYKPRHAIWAKNLSTLEWKKYQSGMYDLQASLYMTQYLASMKGSKGGGKNIWGKTVSIAHRYRRKDSAEIFPR